MSVRVHQQLERANTLLDMLDEEEWSSSKALASELGVHEKTVRRYVTHLRKVGNGIEGVRGKGYRLEVRLPPDQLKFNEEEVTILFLSLCRGRDDFPASQIEGLRKKLLHSISNGSRSRAESLIAESTRLPSSSVNLEMISTIGSALEKQKLLRLTYRGLKDSEAQLRKVQPRRFVHNTGGWYLAAWDVDKQAERSYRLDRLEHIVCLPESFCAPAESEPAKQHPWSFDDQLETVRLELQPPLADWLKKNPVHQSQQIVTEEDGKTYATFQVSSREKFVDWVIGLRGFRLVSPPSYANALRTRAVAISQEDGTLDIPWEIESRRPTVANEFPFSLLRIPHAKK